MSDLFNWLDADGRFRLALMPRPPGGQRLDFAMLALRQRGVDVLASLQTEPEAERCALEREAEAAENAGMTFHRFGIDDHGVPADREAARGFARARLDDLEAGRGVLLHCFAGIGRSGLLAIMIMVEAGFDLEEAARRATDARQLRVPETQTQWSWLQETYGAR